jgi:hypothetical protein
MLLVPAPVVDRLPRRLWEPGNLRFYFGGRVTVHFCYDWRRTIEVTAPVIHRTRVVGRGKKWFEDDAW